MPLYSKYPNHPERFFSHHAKFCMAHRGSAAETLGLLPFAILSQNFLPIPTLSADNCSNLHWYRGFGEANHRFLLCSLCSSAKFLYHLSMNLNRMLLLKHLLRIQGLDGYSLHQAAALSRIHHSRTSFPTESCRNFPRHRETHFSTLHTPV